MKYVEWIEPWSDSLPVPVISRLALKHVLRVQIEKHPLYGSFPDRAIDDFIIVNYGRIVDQV